jgi:cobalt-precorrin 5A hydrolase
MIKKAVCFSQRGKELIEKMNKALLERGLAAAEGYLFFDRASAEEDFTNPRQKIDEWTKENFLSGNALIFVGAVGIAVRAIAGVLKDKLSDCPVVVIDDAGTFVIPILSGHAGGGNKLAAALAELLGAVPVITTSTDVNDAFSVDTFAVENNLSIINREGIKRVSVKALEDKKVTLSIKDYPPEERVDVLVSDTPVGEYSLLLKPKMYTVGIGMKKRKEPAAVEAFFLDTLKNNGIDIKDVYALGTIDIKEDEPALCSLRDKYRIPLISFDKGILEKAQGEFSGSDFVKNTVGVDNVCERSAVLAAGAGSELILKKTAFEGMTIAIARKRNAFI